MFLAAARSPVPGRMSGPHCGNRGAGRAFSSPTSGHGPHRLRDRSAIPAPPVWPGVATGSAAAGTAPSQPGAVGSAVAGHGGHRDGAGEGHVRVPHRDRAGDPEAGVTLLALGAGQPAHGIGAPAGIDRAGAGVGFAERCRIGMPGGARAHLAPHDRHPQLIADHSPHRSPGRASGRGWGSRPGRESGGSGRGRGSGHGGRSGRGPGNGPGGGLWPGTVGSCPGAAVVSRHDVARLGRGGAGIAGRLGVAEVSWRAKAIAGRYGVAGATGDRSSGLGIAWAGGLGALAVPKPGEPGVHRKHAGVLWPGLGRHLKPPVEPMVGRAAAGDPP